tara:strand:- start:8590 stop:9729 length:1140 start_codon:yes stop_codon:yes gene_type:complete
MIEQTKPNSGLEGVNATSSAICYLDGTEGVLAYCGLNIHELAKYATFEEVCFLLWTRRLPTRLELGDLKTDLGKGRVLTEPMRRMIRLLPPSDAMSSLRTLVSALSHFDHESETVSSDAQYRKAIKITAQISTVVAAYGRLLKGLSPVEPDPTLGHAANFLWMLNGERPSDVEAKAFDIALILHADHELNASTFAARVTAATLSDLYSSVVSGIGALKGPLHGGANAEVMKMLEAIGEDATDERVDSFIRDLLSKKVKIPGFGHRVYRTEDPRATHLRVMSREVGERTGRTRWFEISERIEKLMKEEKKIDANVDFYSASTYALLGIETELFTPIFAVSRIAGWTAHILEQYANNRLIRPRAEYIGPTYPQQFVQIGSR